MRWHCVLCAWRAGLTTWCAGGDNDVFAEDSETYFVGDELGKDVKKGDICYEVGESSRPLPTISGLIRIKCEYLPHTNHRLKGKKNRPHHALNSKTR